MHLWGGYALGWAHRGDPAEIERREAMLELTRQGWALDNPAFRQMFTSLYLPEASQEQDDWLTRCSASPPRPKTRWRCSGCSARSTSRDLLGQGHHPDPRRPQHPRRGRPVRIRPGAGRHDPRRPLHRRRKPQPSAAGNRPGLAEICADCGGVFGELSDLTDLLRDGLLPSWRRPYSQLVRFLGSRRSGSWTFTSVGRRAPHRHSTRFTSLGPAPGKKLGTSIPAQPSASRRFATSCDGAFLPSRVSSNHGHASSAIATPWAARPSSLLKSATGSQSTSYSHKVSGGMRCAKPWHILPPRFRPATTGIKPACPRH